MPPNYRYHQERGTLIKREELLSGMVGRLDSMVAERVEPKDLISKTSTTRIPLMMFGDENDYSLLRKAPTKEGMKKRSSIAE
jgi:hypothetical protein